MLGLGLGLTSQVFRMGGSFNPALVPGYTLHIRPADADSVTASSGDVTALSDLSETVNDFVVGASTSPRIGDEQITSKNILQFRRGVSDRLQSTSASSAITDGSTLIIYAVAQFGDLNDASLAVPYSGQMLIGDTNGFWGIHADTELGVIAYAWNGAARAVNTPIKVGSPYVIRYRLSGGTLGIRVGDGTEVTTALTGSITNLATSLRIGVGSGAGAQEGDFMLAEVVGFNDVEALDSDAEIMAYLNAQWIANNIQTSSLRSIAVNNPGYPDKNTLTGRNRQAVRVPYPIAKSCTNPRLRNQNWWYEASLAAGIIHGANDVTILEAALENPDEDTVERITFNGANSLVMEPGADDLLTDSIDLTAFGISALPADNSDMWWVRMILEVPTGGQIPQGNRVASDVTGAQVLEYDSSVTTLSDIMTPGAFTTTGTAPTVLTEGYAPILLGVPVESDIPAFGIFGDSIARKVDDDGTNGVYGRGFLARSLASSGHAYNFPSINFARSGGIWPDLNGSNKWKSILKYVDHIIDENGINEIAVSLAKMKARAEGVWKVANDYSKGILRTEYLPYTTSTDDWQTTGNQTYVANAGSGENTALMNAYFNTKLGDGTIDAVITTDAAKDSGDPLKWVVDGTADYATADGLHPTADIVALLGAEAKWQVKYYVTGVLNPSELELVAWYDPSDADTLWADTSATTPATSALARIDDKSTNGLNLTQAASAGARPFIDVETQNGLVVISLDGSAEFLFNASATLPASMTAFLVFKSSGTNLIPFHKNGSGAFPLLGTSGSGSAPSAGSGTPVYYKNGDVQTVTTRGEGYTVYNGDTHIMTIDNIDASAWGSLAIGSYNSGQINNTGFLGEIVLAQNVTEAQFQGVVNYLGQKWIEDAFSSEFSGEFS